MIKRQIMEKIPFKLLAIFLLLAAGICAGGFVYYQQQWARSAAHIQEDLNTIAQLKSDEITAWRRERFGDAYVLTRSQQFAHAAKNWYQNPGDDKLKEYLYQRLDAFRIYDTYKDVILLNPEGKTMMFIDKGSSERLSQATLSIVREAERQNKIIFSDFYYCGKCQEVHLDVVAPLHDGEINAGAIILRINPDKFLYPLIQRWPSLSKTGETVLIRREGEEVVFLNELRHKKGAAMHLRLPLSDTLLPATMAALGKIGLVEGHDYRGVPVLAVIKPVADSPWFMVTKMDKDEIYAPLKGQARNIMIVIILTILVLAAVLSFIWQADRRGLYKRQYQMELDKQALIRHYDYLTKYANDIIFLLNQDRRIVEVNERGVQTYGYSREELLGMEAGIIRAEGQREEFRAQMEELKAKGALLYETMHRKKDGTAFPVEISARTIEIEGKKYLQGIIRDITERKQYELDLQERKEELEAANQELMASEEELKAADEELRHNMEELSISRTRFAELFKGINNGVAVYRAVDDGADFVFLDFNPAGQRMEHKTRDEVVGKSVTEAFPGVKEMGLFEVFQRVWRTGRPENHPVTFYQNKHLTGWRENYVYRLPTGEVVSIYEDLTAIKQAEEELKENEERYRLVFEAANVGKSVTLPGGQVRANKAFCDMLGYSCEEMARLKWQDITPPEDIEATQRTIDAITKGEKDSVRFEKRYVRKDGSLVWADVSVAGRRDSGGKLLNFITTVVDITERKQAEYALRESEERFKRAVENVPDVMVIYDSELKIKYINNATMQVTGLMPSDFIGKSEEEVWPPEVYQHYLPSLKEALNTGNISIIETDIILSPGIIRSLVITCVPLKNDSGKVVEVLGITHDITERKQHEIALQERKEELEAANQELMASEEELKAAGEELRQRMGELHKTKETLWESEERYHSLFDNSMVGIYRTTADGRILMANPALIRMLGFRSFEDLSGRNLEQEERHDPAYSRTAFKKKLEVEGVISGWEAEWRNPSGNMVYVRESARAIKDADGKILYYDGTVEDITERKQAEEKLKENASLLNIAGDKAKLGGWSVDLINNRCTWSDETAAIHQKPAGYSPLVEEGISYYAPEWRERITKVFTECAQNGVPYDEEMEIITANGKRVWVRTIGEPVKNESGKIIKVQGAFQDITERKHNEKLMILQSEVLKVLTTDISVSQTAEQVVEVIKNAAGLDAVGLRLRTNEDYPFIASIGYSEEFLRTENTLANKYPDGGLCRNEDGTVSLECTCGMIVGGKTDPANPLFTSGGSAWTNNSLPYLDVSPDADARLNPRDRCIHVGFLSLALIPIRSGGDILGLLHLADRHQDRFTPEAVRLFEGIGVSIGVALARKLAEEKLRESEINYRTLADSGQALVWTAGTDKLCNYFNKVWLNFTGRTVEQELGNGWAEGVHPDDLQRCLEIYTGAFDRREKFSMEYRLRRHDGEYRWIRDDGSPRYNGAGEFIGYIGHCLDITERRLAEDQIKDSLKEKDVLLKEIHHRVKNNLQIIASLLNLQTGYVDDPRYKKMFLESQSRVRSMALVHEKLYKSKNLAGIDFSEYVGGLMNDLYSTYGATREGVELSINVLEEKLSIDIAIPCGLIINELVSNSFKYAFKDINGKGRIDITHTKDDAGIFTLEVSDNGPGISADLDLKNAPTLGLQLVDALVGQLGASIRITGENGTKVTIKFKV